MDLPCLQAGLQSHLHTAYISVTSAEINGQMRSAPVSSSWQARINCSSLGLSIQWSLPKQASADNTHLRESTAVTVC